MSGRQSARQPLAQRARGGRLVEREQTMGQNNDGAEADRPWTGVEFAEIGRAHV